MKNFLVLGLIALLLFSVSAALSLWLNQSKQTAEADKHAEKEKSATKNVSHNTEAKEPADSRPPAKTEHGSVAAPPDANAQTSVRDRANLERRATQIEIVLRDIQVQRDTVDATLRQVLAELKTATTSGATSKAGELDTLAVDLEKQKLEMAVTERKNMDKMAALYDVMAPESAAPILKQMAESGKMEMAARLLSRMKERQAAQILAALSDPVLATQLLDKMRALKSTATAPAPGSAVVPARGP